MVVDIVAHAQNNVQACRVSRVNFNGRYNRVPIIFNNICWIYNNNNNRLPTIGGGGTGVSDEDDM